MLVKKIMRTEFISCRRDSNLESIALTMWNHDIGEIPIIDNTGLLLAIITYKDIAVGKSMNHLPLSEIKACEVKKHKAVFFCHKDDNVSLALDVMAEHQIRRVPVMDDNGILVGIITLGDIINCASKKIIEKSREKILYDQVISMMQSIYKQGIVQISPAHKSSTTST